MVEPYRINLSINEQIAVTANPGDLAYAKTVNFNAWCPQPAPAVTDRGLFFLRSLVND
jgi:hypothetical protein